MLHMGPEKAKVVPVEGKYLLFQICFSRSLFLPLCEHALTACLLVSSSASQTGVLDCRQQLSADSSGFSDDVEEVVLLMPQTEVVHSTPPTP